MVGHPWAYYSLVQRYLWTTFMMDIVHASKGASGTGYNLETPLES